MKTFNKRDKTVPNFIRTLIASGYHVVNSHRQPKHIEISCEYKDVFGSILRYLFVVCESSPPTSKDLEIIQRATDSKIQNLVVVCNRPSETSITFDKFFSFLGGTIPTWRALGAEYPKALLESSNNKIPNGFVGEAWLAFEEAVADGLEFIFGSRSVRLGGCKRGKRVADVFIRLPNSSSILVDTKATSTKFDATWNNLRPLVEYTKDQIIRQSGYFSLTAAIIVAPRFKQKTSRLMDISNDFLAETRIPLVFMSAESVLEMTSILSKNVALRNKINWIKILCKNGLFDLSNFSDEIDTLNRMKR